MYTLKELEHELRLAEGTVERAMTKVERAEDTVSRIIKDICSITGACPLCRNGHYPHCEESNV